MEKEEYLESIKKLLTTTKLKKEEIKSLIRNDLKNKKISSELYETAMKALERPITLKARVTLEKTYESIEEAEKVSGVKIRGKHPIDEIKVIDEDDEQR